MKIDVLTIGDALIDFFLFINTANEHCHINQEKCEMCFILGAKIPVEDCKFLLGGNACNVSVGLSRLGLKTSLAAEIGDDEFSKKITKKLQEENIDLTFFKQTPQAEASFAIDLTFAKDRTIFSRHVKRKHDLNFDNADCSYIYLTSIGDEWEQLYEKVLFFVKKKNIKLAFNPGSKQLQAGVKKFENILAFTEILLINKEEAEDILYGTDQKIADELKNPKKLSQELQKLGPKIISITDGNKGSYLMNKEGEFFSQGIIPSKFVQKTGVGDAYASGLLAALFKNENMQNVMKWGAMNSASVVEYIGAQTGLLTKSQLLERIEKF